jgi:hypothetical protein
MEEIARIPNLRGGWLTVHHDMESSTVIIGGRQLDLDGIGQLQVALDNAARDIRACEDGRAGRG